MRCSMDVMEALTRPRYCSDILRHLHLPRMPDHISGHSSRRQRRRTPLHFGNLSLQLLQSDRHPRGGKSIIVSMHADQTADKTVAGKSHHLIIEHPEQSQGRVDEALDELSHSCESAGTFRQRCEKLSDSLHTLHRRGHGIAGWNHRPFSEQLKQPLPPICGYLNDPLNPQAWNSINIFHIPLPTPGKERSPWEKPPIEDLHKTPEEKTLVWVTSIGGACTDSDRILDALCQRHFHSPLSSLVTKDVHGAPKAKFHNDVFTATISVLRSNIGDPLSVTDYPVHAILKGNSLITLDPSGSCFLKNAQTELETEAAPSRLRGVGSLTCHLLERVLDNNSIAVDTLERGIADIRKQVARKQLEGRELLEKLDKAEMSLSYAKRKSNQAKDIIASLMEAAENDSALFANFDPDRIRINLESKIGTLISRIDDQVRALEKISQEHETDQTSLRDKTIAKFTILVGLTAPPIIADFLFGKENHQAMYGSMVVGLFLVAHDFFVRRRRASTAR
jgi:Mg2+ and Co2+ transporter CorA